MERRIGLYVMVVAAAGAVVVVIDKTLRFGVPPMAPVFLMLAIAVPVAMWWRQDAVAWTAGVLLLGGVGLFGLSHGFLIWPALATIIGLVLTATAKRRPAVARR